MKETVPLSRTQDLKLRGSDCLVHDFDDNVVSLKDAKIWFNHDSDYVQPRDTISEINNKKRKSFPYFEFKKRKTWLFCC
tara:strand:- start:509 stop:745 length:237 start_codon:yes stop_codon:yes gene_type:complete